MWVLLVLVGVSGGGLVGVVMGLGGCYDGSGWVL